jgi:hypothetical protein
VDKKMAKMTTTRLLLEAKPSSHVVFPLEKLIPQKTHSYAKFQGYKPLNFEPKRFDPVGNIHFFQIGLHGTDQQNCLTPSARVYSK